MQYALVMPFLILVHSQTIHNTGKVERGKRGPIGVRLIFPPNMFWFFFQDYLLLFFFCYPLPFIKKYPLFLTPYFLLISPFLPSACLCALSPRPVSISSIIYGDIVVLYLWIMIYCYENNYVILALCHHCLGREMPKKDGTLAQRQICACFFRIIENLNLQLK